MKVSVIVPVYCVEKYLDACISSIVNQTYTNLEIIIVDDGSPDNCPQMCDAWAEKDSRIRVIHKENGGQGTARNAGLDVMTGDYILFVDSDDKIMPTMVEKMIGATHNGNNDLVLCGLMVDNTLRTVDTNWYTQSKLCTPREIMYEYLTSQIISAGPVCKLISKLLIADIRFPSFRANEDAYIMHQIIGNCNSAFVLSEYLYIQKIRQGSTEQSGFNRNKMHLIDCAYTLRNYVENNYPEYKEYVQEKVAQDCIVLLDKIYIQNNNKKYSDCEDKIKNILNEEKNILNKNTKTYKQVDMYLNRKFIYKLRIRILMIRTNIKRRIKKLLSVLNLF